MCVGVEIFKEKEKKETCESERDKLYSLRLKLGISFEFYTVITKIGVF